ncbi:Phage-related minor tail protein [Paenibacillus sp. UNC496MF]|uniref:phage tail tape measure protein n=1 Tax=Paenibacillus sp. UNC496MF TaxID=1502753 RepID=UPI0008E0A506|nr:phage tail tape measure protein [Paenibacillus sp. UNC496MF]SFJ44315.1 Phage-related minor tail protein [Paenibacillus sp. UNC496MF]
MSGGILSNLKIGVIFKVPIKPLASVNDKLKTMKDKALEAGGGFDDLKGRVVGFIGIGGNLGQMVDGLADSFFNQTNAFKELQIQTGATGAELDSMKQSTTELYKKGFGEGWDDITNTMASIKQSTNLVGDALKVATRDAIALRDHFHIDPEDSIRTADTLMKNFGITADQAYNLFVQGQQKGLNKAGDMLDTLNEYAPQFKQLGFSASDMMDTLAAGAQKGAFNLDKVGDAVKEFGLRVKDGSGQGAQAMSKWLGKKKAQEYMSAFAKGGAGAKTAFTEVVQQLGKVQNASEKNYLSTQLFGTQYEDLGKDVIAAFADVPKQFDVLKQSMDEAAKPGFMQSLQGLGRTIQVNLIAPIGTKLAPKLQQFSGWLQKHPSTVKTMTMVIGGLALGLGALVAVTYTVAAVQGIASMAVAGWNTVTKVASVVTKAWTAVQWLLNAAMAANPIVLIVLGIAALVAGIIIAYKKVGWFRDAVNSLWDGLKKGVSIVGNAVSEAWGAVKSGVISGINWVLGKVNSVIKSVNKVTSKLPKALGGGALQISTIPLIGGDKPDGSHRSGLDNVPFDGYRAELHKGERVLTKRENEHYGKQPPVEVHVHVAGTNATAADIATAVKKVVQDIFSSAMRREGLEVSGQT